MSFPSTNSLSTLHAYFPESLNPLLHHSTPGISTSLSMNNCFLHASGSLSKGNSSSSSRVLFSSFSSVAQLCTTLCNSMDCSMWGFPVHHQLPELAKVHVHLVGDAIQPSHPLLSPSPVFNLSPHQGLFQWVSSSHQVAKVLEFQLQHQPFQRIFRVDFL